MRAINTFLTLKILANCQMSTGSLMTRQTYDRAPRLTNLATAHISKGADAEISYRHRRQNAISCSGLYMSVRVSRILIKIYPILDIDLSFHLVYYSTR